MQTISVEFSFLLEQEEPVPTFQAMCEQKERGKEEPTSVFVWGPMTKAS
jgi:hypothetical protein